MNRASHDKLFDELFARYWQWLLDRFRSGTRLEYSPKDESPGKGNPRCVEDMDEGKMQLRETRAGRRHSECLMTELRDDFRKLSQDPEVDHQKVRVLGRKHDIKNWVEFKRHMFEEFRQFTRGLPDLQPAPASTKTIASTELSNDVIQVSDQQLIAKQEQQLAETGVFAPGNLRDARERIIAAIVRRRGQPAFRRQLLRLYCSKCAISGCDVEAALDAAHIVPYRGPETNHPTNGLLLRTDLHTLFDLGLIAIETKTMTVLIAPSLEGTCYQEYAGKRLNLPSDPATYPSLEALDQHRASTGRLYIR